MFALERFGEKRAAQCARKRIAQGFGLIRHLTAEDLVRVFSSCSGFPQKLASLFAAASRSR
jgi:hypothetical protein